MATPRFIQLFTTCNLLENEAPLFGRRAVLERDMQPLPRGELDSNVLKFRLLDGHIIDVSKRVLTR